CAGFMTSTDSPIVLITGGNAGIGFHVSQQLARAGARVLMGSRDPARGASAAADLADEGLEVEPVVLDVTVDATISAVTQHLADTYGRLDVLINNAAIVGEGLPPTQASRTEMLATFDTNVAGIVALTNALLPALRSSDRRRILNVSSELGSTRLVNDPDWLHSDVAAAAYQASKAALDMLTVMYAKELAEEGFSVLSVSPGYRATGLSRGAPTPGAGDPAEGAAGISALALAAEVPTGRFLSDHGELVAW
ncbi:SDR family NAD(P)-dependent oxidoreductase, partial [Micrococcus luteus]|uniref:SDR family NAD(P)-dependent oxidoreductase n=1 Tax=Micrococcus luteus TaxID=1270 RepID=UPI0034240CC7